MEAPRKFWGLEVKAGQSIKVGPKTSTDGYIHISQVALGAAKKGKPSESVVLYLKVGKKKFVLGTLSNDNIPHILLDIVLHRESEFFHNSKNATVYICGYKIIWDDKKGDDAVKSDNVNNENGIALEDQDTGKVKAAKGTKYGKTVFEIGESSKQVKISELSKKVKIIDLEKDEDDFYDVSSDEDDSDSFNPMDISDEESESYEVSDYDEEDEYISAKKVVGKRKKRTNKSPSKTSVSSKKAKKATTPKKKAGAKKGVQTATSHPMKKGGKTRNNVSKDQILDSGDGETLNNISKDLTLDSGDGKTPDNISNDPAPDFGGEKTPNDISKDQAPGFGEKRNYIDLNETYEEQLSG